MASPLRRIRPRFVTTGNGISVAAFVTNTLGPNTFMTAMAAKFTGWRDVVAAGQPLTWVQDYAIFMLDPGGRVASWNAGAERLLGYRSDEILGAHLARFFTEPDVRRGMPDQNLEQARLQGRTEDEGWRLCKDGSRFQAN